MDVLKQLHTSVAQSFEKSFDNAYRDLNIELARRYEQSKEAEEVIAKVQKLEHEIAILKDKSHPCEVDSKSKKFFTSMQETYGPEHVLGYLDDSGMGDLHPEVKVQIVETGAKYRGLYKHFNELIEVCGALRVKVDSHKQKLVQWHDRITREEFTIELSGAPVKFQRVHGAQCTSNQLQLPPSRPKSLPSEPVNHRARPEASTLDLNQLKPKLLEDPKKQDIRHKHDIGSNTQTHYTTELPESASTNSDVPSTTEETASNDCTSDASTGTTARELKRKRVLLPEPNPQDPPLNDDSTEGRLQRPIVIKSESMSSSPLRNFSGYRAPTGSQDLDEIGSSVETPTKKNRPNRNYHNQGDPSGTNVFEAASAPEQDYKNFQRQESEWRTPRQSGALRPIDNNARVVNFSDQRSTKPKRNPEKTAKYAIPSIAEDGENYVNVDTAQRIGKPVCGANESLPNTNNAPAQQRLQDLLESPLPSRLPLNAQRSHAQPSNTAQSSARGSGGVVDQSSRENRRNLSATNPKPLQEVQEPRVRTPVAHIQKPTSVDAHANSTEARTGNRPYRDRSLEQFELSHFKINSEYNHGLDFAFDTVVRRKDERKCMSGCTRPGCCGEKFLSMARIGGLPTNLERSSLESEERKILEDYLGDDKHLLDIMDPKDRAGLLHEAQARLLADAYGKHRHNHPRSSTPPGFWRTDMPDTQELERDREEARKQEREKVHERYREARRPGGLWKFADE